MGWVCRSAEMTAKTYGLQVAGEEADQLIDDERTFLVDDRLNLGTNFNECLLSYSVG